MNVYLVGARSRQIEELLHAGGARTTQCDFEALTTLASQPALPAEVVVADVRERSALPPSIALLKRNHPLVGVVIIASSLDPVLMLEAMRAGVTEFVTEPVTQVELAAAVGRVTAKQSARDPG